eukprot:scaffold7379_cov126-Isochrysis_galbana.AAC.7
MEPSHRLRSHLWPCRHVDGGETGSCAWSLRSWAVPPNAAGVKTRYTRCEEPAHKVEDPAHKTRRTRCVRRERTAERLNVVLVAAGFKFGAHHEERPPQEEPRRDETEEVGRDDRAENDRARGREVLEHVVAVLEDQRDHLTEEDSPRRRRIQDGERGNVVATSTPAGAEPRQGMTGCTQLRAEGCGRGKRAEGGIGEVGANSSGSGAWLASAPWGKRAARQATRAGTRRIGAPSHPKRLV